MVDVAVVILRVVAEIDKVAKDIKENDRQACRLLKRVSAIEPPVLAVQEGTKLSSSKSLDQLKTTVEKIRDFLEEYSRTNKLERARKSKANANKFTQLGVVLTEGMQALHLEVAVATWAKEDASDRLEDLEHMVDMMERMERERTDNHAEVMGVLKTLQNEERSELEALQAWVEIDYVKDLDLTGSVVLGSGGFGEVRTAKWGGDEVAVKRLYGSPRLPLDSVRALRRELRVHASLHFGFVAPLYAASTIGPHLCLVVELASRGSLQQYLDSASEPLEHALQTAFLYDIARGMSFLHMRGIMHRDLKSANVLMFDNRRLKLCDFGLSKVKTDLSSSSKTGFVGTSRWMCPEVMTKGPANERTDVYSFGVVCFEVATRTLPFKEMDTTQVILTVVFEKGRPQIPEGASVSPDVLRLMEKCWKQEPADRPEGFEPVVETLARVVSRDGDPRNHGAAGVDVTSSSGVKGSGASSHSASTAPPTVSGGVGASNWAEHASQPAAADSGTTPDGVLSQTVPGSGRDVSAKEENMSWSATKEVVIQDAKRAHSRFDDVLTAIEGRSSSSGASGQLERVTEAFDGSLTTRDKHKNGQPHKPPLVGSKMGDSDDLDVVKDLRNQVDRSREQLPSGMVDERLPVPDVPSVDEQKPVLQEESKIPDVHVTAPDISEAVHEVPGHLSVPEVVSDVRLPELGGDVPLAGVSASPPDVSFPGDSACVPSMDLVGMMLDMPSIGGDVSVTAPSVDASVTAPDGKMESGDTSLFSGQDADVLLGLDGLFTAAGLSGNKPCAETISQEPSSGAMDECAPNVGDSDSIENGRTPERVVLHQQPRGDDNEVGFWVFMCRLPCGIFFVLLLLVAFGVPVPALVVGITVMVIAAVLAVSLWKLLVMCCNSQGREVVSECFR